MIDLHTHSTASDGSLTPAELVREAAGADVRALALTDHDSVAGNAEAQAEGVRADVEVIAGVELSASHPRGNMHLLGLWLPPAPVRLVERLADVHADRERRNRRIAERLSELGLPVTYEEILAQASGTVGRPHIAQLLVDKRYLTSTDEAFKHWLGPRGRAYVPKTKLDVAEAIELLKHEGATVMLAHPVHLEKDADKLEPLLRELQRMGLDGIEAYYTDHSPIRTRDYLALAERLNMVVCGGSDFHGRAKPKNRIGVGTGTLHVPDAVLDQLKAYRRTQGLPV